LFPVVDIGDGLWVRYEEEVLEAARDRSGPAVAVIGMREVSVWRAGHSRPLMRVVWFDNPDHLWASLSRPAIGFGCKRCSGRRGTSASTRMH